MAKRGITDRLPTHMQLSNIFTVFTAHHSVVQQSHDPSSIRNPTSKMLASRSLPNQSADIKSATASFSTLPAELLLEIIPYIPFTSRNLSHLRLTNTKLHHLVQGHEHGLVKDIKRTQIPLTSLRLFPSLGTETYSGLSTLHARLSTLDDLHSEWLRITSSGPDLDWLKGRWESVHKIGLLLLYRLQDTGSYPNKVALLNSLPTTSLACLLFKLIASIKILRIYGPCPINGHHAAGDILQRSDIELAFEEMLLQHGPDFFLAMLKAGDKSHPKSEWAIAYVPP